MRNPREFLPEFRQGRSAYSPDQSIYAAFACAQFGLEFRDLDGGSGLLFSVASREKTLHFGAGRCVWYPQNNATAASLASDKHFTAKILAEAGVPVINGEYFFLHERHRAHRPAGHERDDALAYFARLGASAFVKPLAGSRGDFAQALHGGAALIRYLDEVAKYYDAVLIQPIVEGAEYRIFLLDDDALYCARKHPPFVRGDGVHTWRELLVAHNDALHARGLSPVSPGEGDRALDAVPAKGEQRAIPGRMNLSAGGTMALEPPPSANTVALARAAVRALGLRVAAVDLFAGAGGDPEAIVIIEVNSNPSIRLLEQSGRGDLILKIWRHTFSAMGLL
jgi:glutathione synthase/RimK-type ligase-like ATP-grasp enzyme